MLKISDNGNLSTWQTSVFHSRPPDNRRSFQITVFMFRRQSRLCDLFVLNRIKKVRFSTKSLHISAFLPKYGRPIQVDSNLYTKVELKTTK